MATVLILCGCQPPTNVVRMDAITNYEEADAEKARIEIDVACSRSDLSHQEVISKMKAINAALDKNESKENLDRLFVELKAAQKSSLQDLERQCLRARSQYEIIINSMANAAKSAVEINREMFDIERQRPLPINCVSTRNGTTSYTTCY